MGITAKVIKKGISTTKIGGGSGAKAPSSGEPTKNVIKVTISDAVGISGGGQAGSPNQGISVRKFGSSSGGGVQVDVSGLSKAESDKKIKEARNLLIRQERMEADQRRLDEDNRRLQEAKQKQINRLKQRFPTQYGVYVKGGYIVDVTKGSLNDLLRLQRQKAGSVITQDPSGENYELVSSSEINLAQPANLRKLNEQIRKEGGIEYTPLEKTAAGGSKIIRNIEDSVGAISEQSGVYGETKAIIDYQEQSRKPQVSTSEFAFDEGGTVTVSKEKYIVNTEERNRIKDYLKQNKAETYQIYDESGKLIKVTSGRSAYPDILKYTLAGPVSIQAVSKLKPNQQTVFIGAGTPAFTIEREPTETILPVYGPPEKPESFNIPRPDRTITGAATEAGSLLLRPVTNIASDVEGIITGKENKAKPTIVDNVIKATEEYVTPAVRQVIAGDYGFIKVRKATREEIEASKSAYPRFFEQTEKQFKESPKEVIFPFLGEVGLNLVGFAAVKGGASVFNYVMKNKYVVQAAKDLRGVLAPKQVVDAKLTEKIPFSGRATIQTTTPAEEMLLRDISGVSKDIGGTILVPTRVSVKSIGGSVVKVESESIKQGTAVFYDVKLQKFTAVEGVSKGSKLPAVSRVRGSLSDDTAQQVAQQKKFGLTQLNKDLFSTTKGRGVDPEAEANLMKALESQSIAYIGKVKTFTLEQVKREPKAFGRYFFGGEVEPTKAVSEIGLLETRGYLTGGTKIGNEAPTRIEQLISKEKTNIPVTSRTGIGGKAVSVKGYEARFIARNRNYFGTIFKPFKIGTIKGLTIETKVRGAGNFIYSKLTTERFFKRLPLSSFVTDVQKNIRFVDPFSKSGKSFFGTRINRAMLGTTDTGFGKYSTGKAGQTLAETKPKGEFTKLTPKKIEEQLKEEMDILFKDPRFKDAYGTTSAGIIGAKQMETTEYAEPTRQLGGGPRMIESPLEGKYETFDDALRKINSKLTKEESPFVVSNKLFEEVSPRRSSLNKFLINITPSLKNMFKPDTTLKTTPDLTTRITPKITTRQLQRITPELTTKLVTEIVPILEPIPEPLRPIEEKIITTGFFPKFAFGADIGVNESSGRKSKKFYTIFDVAKTPFGKINVYLGYQEQSYSPIQEIRRRLKYPIGQKRPANIIGFDFGNIYKKSRIESEYF